MVQDGIKRFELLQRFIAYGIILGVWSALHTFILSTHQMFQYVELPGTIFTYSLT